MLDALGSKEVAEEYCPGLQAGKNCGGGEFLTMAVLFIFYYLKKHELGFEFTYSSYLAKEQVYVRIQKFMCNQRRPLANAVYSLI